MPEMRLHDYQEHCVQRIIDGPSVGLFLDMGLGKTAITLHAIKRLKYDYWAVRKVLVVAPKKVAESTWPKEATKWPELSCLRFALALGDQKHRIAALESTADVYVIGRDNFRWAVEYFKNRWPFDMVVIDESSGFKNSKSKRFRAFKMIRGKVARVVELTGTPTPRSLEDLWAQVYLLDAGQRLGRTLGAYRDAFFTPDKRNRNIIYSYATRAGADVEIFKLIEDICISMKSEDYLQLPDLVYNEIPVVLDKPAQAAYDRLERDALLQMPDDDTVITAGSAATLTGKLLQLCNGAAYDEDGNVQLIHDCKLQALMETVEQLNGQHAIICYNFKHDRERLLQALTAAGYNAVVYEGIEQENAWNAGEIELLLVQPASCGYGLNLQQGGHHLIWFGLTWSLELYQQTNKRLHRQGQPFPVIIHHLVTQGGVDEDVLQALGKKDAAQESLLAALKAKIHSAREENI